WVMRRGAPQRHDVCPAAERPGLWSGHGVGTRLCVTRSGDPLRTCGGLSCGYVRSVLVKVVVQVRLLPTPEQAAALELTRHACNEAASCVSEVAFERGEFKNFPLRKHT